MTARDSDGRFQLVLEMPKATWSSDEAIDGTATLSPIGSGTVSLNGSGSGLLGFEYREVGGSRKADWIRTADCGLGKYVISTSAPMVAKLFITMSSLDAFANYEASFPAGTGVHLPAGDWTISAVAVFGEGNDCGGSGSRLRATIQVHVTG